MAPPHGRSAVLAERAAMREAVASAMAAPGTSPESGWSDPPRHPRRTPGLMAADLYAMLHAAGAAPPYVLAGHSIGGIVARQFYAQHPDETVGILLIDSSHEDQARRFGASGWQQGAGAYLKVTAQRQARILGARRLASSLGLMPDLADGVPPEYAGAARAIALSTRQRRTSVREVLMMTRLRGTPPGLGSVPLTVLTALGKMDRDRLRIWVEMQDELAALSSDSLRITAPDAPHYMHQYDPDLVVRAICDLVERVRC